MQAKRETRISKFLSLVLRHQPEKIGITLDEGGWVAVDELIARATQGGMPFTRAELDQVVTNNAKQRFAYSEDGSMLRASQGHSVAVELGYEPADPAPGLPCGHAPDSLPPPCPAARRHTPFRPDSGHYRP